MNRLIETETSDPALRAAQDVLRAIEPKVTSEFAMARVRGALDREPAPRARRLVPWLVAAGLCLLAGGALAAAFVHERAAPKPGPAPSAVSRIQAPREVIARGVPAAPSESPPEAQPVVTAPAVPPPAHRALSKAHGDDQAELNEVRKIHEAATALRRDGNPAQASRLLDSIPANPSSPLAEEALALRIEAARAQHGADLKALANKYLRQYPNGRYAEAARQALASAPR